MRRLGIIAIVIVFLIGCGLWFIQAPKIPHKITEGIDCKSCHATGINDAPVSPHPNNPDCMSCHKAK